MSVVRTKKSKHNPYMILDTTALNDDRLSYRAKGLHTYLMSKPDGWQVYIEQLEKTSPREGRDAIRTALAELQHAGYLHREKARGTKGRMAGWDTTVYETPTLAAHEAQTARAPQTIYPPEPAQPTTDYPTSDQPTSVQPSSVYPPLVCIEEKLVLTVENIEGKESPLAPPFGQRLNGQNHHQAGTWSFDEPSLQDDPPSLPPQSAPPPPPKKVTPAKTHHLGSLLPTDFVLTPDMMGWAQAHMPSLNVQNETDSFMDWARSKGMTSLDWVARWRNWMRKALEIHPPPTPHKRGVVL